MLLLKGYGVASGGGGIVACGGWVWCFARFKWWFIWCVVVGFLVVVKVVVFGGYRWLRVLLRRCWWWFQLECRW